jgi:DNA-binding Lrp family transcriptional regulator
MNIAFVLVNTNLGADAEVGDALRKVDEVKEVYGVYGVYDIVVRIEAETLDQLKETISSFLMIRRPPRSTLTMIVV